MKALYFSVLLLTLSGCQTMDAMQEDISDLSNSLFSSEDMSEESQDAFLKAQEAFYEADNVRKKHAQLNAQERSLWVELEDDYNILLAAPSKATEKESYFSDSTLADSVMMQSLKFIELVEKGE
ncbi:hypothetical protein NQU96_18680 [Pseudoalteromonas elyakovii]|jgi:predicted small secreted protein|uniref:Uncharacterized protein n=2 Tax=Pseudoalteromonas TaxID=53246 RepID=A0ABQ1U683_9GAMM|nr:MULTISPECIES: hypothetical protein [Pseudoalteromonas]MDC3191766.1 hypothetical protein [Pseudoalteromonas elyakovii]KZY42795.1 hypothetical protein A3733_19160 [Pseudoalteromonas shioyasakiensis]MCO7208661.1 hypothetical protein [Pseudoalteromonas sp. CnMc7-37]MCZ4253590.1 hypothetical protein [Pseudoalteromonas shioyasakiensis]MDI4671387.1 hypothetical protein [Pseudoalteromonas shioyasakiensis]|tara:strand:+ start:431 stop:802 length:372 start_codon:yes stop_codon:yes gene_type:complete